MKLSYKLYTGASVGWIINCGLRWLVLLFAKQTQLVVCFQYVNPEKWLSFVLVNDGSVIQFQFGLAEPEGGLPEMQPGSR
jgi:hypothetical protein